MLCICWDWPWKLESPAAHCEEIPNWWYFPNFDCTGWTFWGRWLPRAWITLIFYPSIPSSVCTHHNVIFNGAVTRSSLQLASSNYGIFGARSGRRKGTAHRCPSLAAALVLAVPPALSHVFSTELGRSHRSAWGCQRCLWCSPQPSSGTQFLSISHEVFGLNPLVPGQTDVSVSTVAQRTKSHCQRAARGHGIWCKEIHDCGLLILTTKKLCNNTWPTLTSRTDSKCTVVLENCALTVTMS